MSRATRIIKLAVLSSTVLGTGLQAVEAEGNAVDVQFLDEFEWVEAVSRRRQALSKAPQAVSVIDYGQEYHLPPWTIPDRLRYEAGVDVYQRRHGQFDVGVRGFNGHGTSRTLVLIDDIDITLEELGQVQWLSHVHPSDVVRMEVVKGPSSVSYGANAFGGVISMQGRRVADVHEVHTFADAGTDGLLDLDATALGPLHLSSDRRVWYKISAGYTERDDFPGTRGVPSVAHNLADHTGDTDLVAGRAAAQIGYEFQPGWEVRAEARYIDIDDWDSIEDFSPGSNTVDKREIHAGLALSLPFGELRWRHSDNKQDYSNQRSLFDPTNPAHIRDLYGYTRLYFDGEADDVRLSLNHRFGQHTLAGGAEFRYWQSQSNLWQRAEGPPETDYSNVAVFAEDQWEPNDQWVLSLGARYDDHSVVGGNLSPRLALNYAIDPRQFVRFSLSSGYRLPNSFELYMEEWFYTVDRDQIEVEKVLSLDMGWECRLPEWQSRFKLGAFYSRVTDPLAFMPVASAEMEAGYTQWLLAGDFTQAPGPFFEYRNVDNGITVIGLEAEWRSRLRDGVELWATGTLQDLQWDEDFRFQSDGFIEPLSGQTLFAFDYSIGDRDAPPPAKVNVGVNLDRGDWFGSAVGRYVAAQKFFANSASYWLSSQGVALRERPAYLAMDLALGYRWARQGYRRFVRLSVLDVFDSAHYEAYEVPTEVLVEDNEWQWSSSIGRQIALVLAWEF
jgi:outer membrane cobalamin receptor